MIKNIVLDMGNVLLNYDPNVCLQAYVEDAKDRELIRKELFQGPESPMQKGMTESAGGFRKGFIQLLETVWIIG